MMMKMMMVESIVRCSAGFIIKAHDWFDFIWVNRIKSSFLSSQHDGKSTRVK